MKEIVFAFPGHEPFARLLAARPGSAEGALVLRRFPDGESYVRLDAPVAGGDAHATNAIDVNAAVAEAVKQVLTMRLGGRP